MTWSAHGYRAIAEFVSGRTGLALTSRRAAIEQGIRAALARARLTDLGVYLERLRSDATALDDLVGELTVGETYFFREPEQFEFLRREVLPGWRLRAEQGHTLRVWSAGCASGEEAYTVAMLLDQEGLGEHSHILATDISRVALARAQRGVYGSWSLRGQTPLAALPYLQRSGAQHRLHERIRQRVTFDYLNLALDVYPSLANGVWNMDLVLCRNVLIYFDRHTIECVAQRLAESLAADGWLLTAASDPPLADFAPLQSHVTPEGVFYRRLTAPPRDVVEPLPEWEPPVDPEEPLEAPVVAVSAPVEDERAVLKRIRTLANLETTDAEAACAAALRRFPLSVELHYLHAVVLLDLRRDEEAMNALRRVLYLDRSLALAHFLLGTLLKRRADREGARRAYRNARDLCAARPVDELVPLAEGERAGRLAEAAAAQLALLDEEASS